MASQETPAADITALGLIGFGEVGKALAKGLTPDLPAISAYDIAFEDAERGPSLKQAARDLGVTPVDQARDLAQDGTLILSCVTAGSAVEVATNAATWMRPGQFFLDVNSISPDGKRAGAEAVEAAGGRYVEAAIMSPIHPKGHEAPMLFGGKAAPELAAFLETLGMRITVESEDIGQASANKMCRSIMVKGIEALVVECFVTAREYGVDGKVIDSLDKTFPGMDWRKSGAYMLERVLVHGERRAEEMRCSAETVAAAGWTPHMATATAERQQWVVDHIPRDEAVKLGDEPLEAILDRLVKELEEN